MLSTQYNMEKNRYTKIQKVEPKLAKVPFKTDQNKLKML